MDIGSLIKLLLRRWYIVVPCLALTLVPVPIITDSIKPEYEVSGAVLFLGPEIREVELESGETDFEPTNPLLALGGSLGQTSSALALALGSQNVRADFADRGLEPTYELGADERSPIMQFLVTSDDAEKASATLEALLVWVEADLDDRQQAFDLGPKDLISVSRLSDDNEPSVGITNRRRAQVLLAGSGIMITLFLAVATDVWLSRRKLRFPESDEVSREAIPAEFSGETSDGGDGTPLPTENRDVSVAVGDPVDEQPHSITEEEEEEAVATPRPPWVPNSPSPTRRRSRRLLGLTRRSIRRP